MVPVRPDASEVICARFTCVYLSLSSVDGRAATSRARFLSPVKQKFFLISHKLANKPPRCTSFCSLSDTSGPNVTGMGAGGVFAAGGAGVRATTVRRRFAMRQSERRATRARTATENRPAIAAG